MAYIAAEGETEVLDQLSAVELPGYCSQSFRMVDRIVAAVEDLADTRCHTVGAEERRSHHCTAAAAKGCRKDWAPG